MLLAIDPGVHTGWCVLNTSLNPPEIQACGLGLKDLHPILAQIYHMVAGAVIEVPQVYPRSPVPPNDLITLAVTAGRIMGVLEDKYGFTFKEVWPKQWKGSVPKSIHNRRILASLSEANKYHLNRCLKGFKVAKSNENNVIDAVGLSLWYVGRREG